MILTENRAVALTPSFTSLPKETHGGQKEKTTICRNRSEFRHIVVADKSGGLF